MYDFITKAAYESGFRRAYFLPPDAIEGYCAAARASGVGEKLVFAPKETYEWASSVVLLVYPYAPFTSDERIPAYYLASNKAYHAAKRIESAITERGFFAKTDCVPARALALKHGIGARGRNALLRIDPFGSRIVLSTIITNAAAPHGFLTPPSQPCPDNCRACEAACPSNAIYGGAYDARRCIRFHMDGADHPPFVLERLTTYLGCEVCQYACPLNAALDIASPSAEERDAFSLERLLSFDAKAARALVGRNITSNGKLRAEAVAFAARDGGHGEEVAALSSSDITAVKNAALWALHNF